MERHRRVWRVWNWLPAFRAAAEYESLQRAALAVSLSPSALSRSISLLEKALGVPLFVRSPRGLTLTARGHQLLAATRDAVRLVDEALPSSPEAGRFLRACAAGPVLPVVLAEAVGDALPDWTTSIDSIDDHTLIESLRCGDIDFVLTHQPPMDEGIEVVQLPSVELVLAGVVQSRHRVVSMRAAGYFERGADFTASSWASAERLAQKLGLPVVAPRCLVREGTPVTPLNRSLPVFAVWRREILPGQADPLRKLAAAASAFIGPASGEGRVASGK